MFRDITFSNSGLISILDLTTMGDSVKRDSPSKIGKFDSGLKYAMAILLRNGIEMIIYSGDREFRIGKLSKQDPITLKEKTVMVIHTYVNGQFESSTETSFSPELGYNWKLWMAFRELYSNMLDEHDGQFFVFANSSGKPAIVQNNETIIYIKGNEKTETILDNWSNYFIKMDTVGLISTRGNIQLFKNRNSDYLKVYKKGILVYADPKIKAHYSYIYENAELDERRKMSNFNTFKDDATYCLSGIKDENEIETFLFLEEDLFEKRHDFYYSIPRDYTTIANKLFKENKLITNRSLLEVLKNNSNAELGSRLLKVNESTYTQKVEVSEIVEETPAPLIQTEEGFIDESGKLHKSIEEAMEEHQTPLELAKFIVEKYDFKTGDIELKAGKIESTIFKVAPDKTRKTIYIALNFTEEDIEQLLKAIYLINGENIFKDYYELLKKNL